MSMTRDYGEIVFECDSPNCLETMETSTESWEVAKSRFDFYGWQTRQFRGNWEHYCPACKLEGI